MGAANHQFCSVENQRMGEPLVGKGGITQPHLLLTWPRRKWADHIFAAKDMPESICAQLEALREQGWRVQLIDRRGHDHSVRRVLAPMSGQEYAAQEPELPHLLDALLDGEAAAAPWRSGTTAERLLLCCTHGKVDRCCAKFGNAAYQAILAENEARAYGFDVWESSHVGGCRLAANVVTLPVIRRYGRVTPETVPELLASEIAGRPYLPCFRGTTGLNPAEQCADLAARHWLSERELDAEPAVVSVDTGEAPEAVQVTLRWISERLEGVLAVRCQSQELTGYSNCEDLSSGESFSARAWRAVSVTPVTSPEARPWY